MKGSKNIVKLRKVSDHSFVKDFPELQAKDILEFQKKNHLENGWEEIPIIQERVKEAEVKEDSKPLKEEQANKEAEKISRPK